MILRWWRVAVGRRPRRTARDGRRSCHAAGAGLTCRPGVVLCSHAERLPMLVTAVTLMARVLTPLLALAPGECKTAPPPSGAYRDERNPHRGHAPLGCAV